jgi:hypothetical protein
VRRLFAEQLLRLFADIRLLRFAEKCGVHASELCANRSGTIDKDHKRNKGPLTGGPLQILQCLRTTGLSNGERRIVGFDEFGNVAVLIDGRFNDLKSLGLQIFCDATQDLSGFLAVRSSGENEYQAQYFAVITAHQQILAVGKVNHELRRLPRKLSRECGAGEECQGEQYFQTHHEI